MSKATGISLYKYTNKQLHFRRKQLKNLQSTRKQANLRQYALSSQPQIEIWLINRTE